MGVARSMLISAEKGLDLSGWERGVGGVVGVVGVLMKSWLNE